MVRYSIIWYYMVLYGIIWYGVVLGTHHYYHRTLDQIDDEEVAIEYIRHPADVLTCSMSKYPKESTKI